MSIQDSRNTPDMAECCATGPGGHKQLVNNNEADILDRTIEDATNVSAPAGYTEDDSHVMGVYKMMASDFGGS